MTPNTSELFFIANYNNVEVPPRIVTRESINEEILEKTTAFFDAISIALDMANLAIHLPPAYNAPKIETYTAIDRVNPESYEHQLWFGDVQILATFSRRRNEEGLQVIHFFKNRLLPETIEARLEIEKIDRMML